MHRRLEALQKLLGSQLRLQLVAELLTDEEGLTVDEAAMRTACPAGDVLACFRPLGALGVLEASDGDTHWRLRPGLAPEGLAVLRAAVRKGADHLERQRHVRDELLSGMIGTDPKMQLVTEMARKVARLEVPVLITGETGTGKELVARAIHALSPRSSGFFGDVNCANLADALFESHVFGHARGAFTGAVAASAGLMERVNGGTLFLDEIGELGLPTQAKLLKVLQNHGFTRLGETTQRWSDFRLVSATNRHLPSMVAAGQFREDLFYRINVFPIALPALRERLGDVPLLVDELVHRQLGRKAEVPRPTLTPLALARLQQHPWPGNIRELENVVTRALIASNGATIDEAHLPAYAPAPMPAVARTPALRSLAEVEREHMAHVLDALNGNVTEAARVLGVARNTLYRLMKTHGLAVRKAVAGVNTPDSGTPR